MGERIREYNNWRTGKPYTEEEIMMYDLPPDELERKLHPVLSRRLDKRLAEKAEREKNSPEAYDKEMNEWFGEGVTNYV